MRWKRWLWGYVLHVLQWDRCRGKFDMSAAFELLTNKLILSKNLTVSDFEDMVEFLEADRMGDD